MYKGWKIATVGFLSMFAYSLAAFGLPVFVKPITGELSWSRTGFMWGVALGGFFAAGAGSAGGLLLDWVGGAPVIAAGAIAEAAALFALGGIHGLLRYYLLSCVLGVGLGLVGQVPVTAVVSRWFDLRRGTALALAMAGIAIGGMVAPLGCAELISLIGWRSTLRWMGAATVLLVPVAVLMIRNPKPEEVRNEFAPTHHRHSDGGEFSIAAALKTRAFWLFFASFFLVWFYTTSVISNLVVYMEDCGYQPTHAAAALSAILGLGLVGKFVYGVLGDRIGAFNAYVQLQIALLIAAICLIFLTVSPVFVGGLVLAHGLGVGGFLVLSGLVVTRRFGTSGGIFGATMLSMIPATVLAPVIPARFYDLGWGYRPFFILLTCCNLVGVLIAAWLYFDSKQPLREKAPAQETG